MTIRRAGAPAPETSDLHIHTSPKLRLASDGGARALLLAQLQVGYRYWLAADIRDRTQYWLLARENIDDTDERAELGHVRVAPDWFTPDPALVYRIEHQEAGSRCDFGIIASRKA